MIDHYRFQTDTRGWEIPAGRIESGEIPEQAAARELMEETGHRAASFRYWGRYHPSNGSSNQVFHVFVARGVTRVGDIQDTNEVSGLRWFAPVHKPICDATHCEISFDGTETADTGATAARQEILGGTQIVVKRDASLCSESGFCGTRFAKIEKMVAATDDTNVRSQVIALIERCPSGSLTYALATGQADIEPDLPQQIAVTTEITSEGPLDGPLWVTGNIPIERSDGQPFATRNRVALCACGRSKNKPLCDGTHRSKEKGA
jgi:CDGSH-type Zn-finger protein